MIDFMDNRRDYYLLLGDLESSTAFSPSQADEVRAKLGICTQQSGQHIVAGLELNYGDEFAALFTRLLPICETVCTLRHALRGLATFRFAVARGRIGAAADTLREMGGPVFKTANDALVSLKKQRRFARWLVADDLTNRTLDNLTLTSNAFIQDMTDYQYTIYRELKTGLSHTEIARALGKHDQSVSLAAQRAHALIVLETESLLRAHLERIDQANLVENGKSIEND